MMIIISNQNTDKFLLCWFFPMNHFFVVQLSIVPKVISLLFDVLYAQVHPFKCKNNLFHNISIEKLKFPNQMDKYEQRAAEVDAIIAKLTSKIESLEKQLSQVKN
jgi:hypothetical protein